MSIARKDAGGIASLCALAAIAFVVACAAHEALGHGGACLMTGGTIQVLSSSVFRCTPPQPAVDLAGPLMSFAIAALAAVWLRLDTRHGRRRIFAALLLAIAGFWVAGEMIIGGVADRDDLAFVLHRLALPLWLWRAAMALAGGLLYIAVLRRAAADLPRGGRSVGRI